MESNDYSVRFKFFYFSLFFLNNFNCPGPYKKLDGHHYFCSDVVEGM